MIQELLYSEKNGLTPTTISHKILWAVKNVWVFTSFQIIIPKSLEFHAVYVRTYIIGQ